MSASVLALSWRGLNGWTTSTGLVEQRRSRRSRVVNRRLDTRLLDAYARGTDMRRRRRRLPRRAVDVGRRAPQDVTGPEAAAPAACEGPRVPCQDSHGQQLPPPAARQHGEEARRRPCESTWEFNGPAARVASADLERGVPGLLDHLTASEADRRTPSGKTELIRNRHTSRAYELFHHLPVRRPVFPLIALRPRHGQGRPPAHPAR